MVATILCFNLWEVFEGDLLFLVLLFILTDMFLGLFTGYCYLNVPNTDEGETFFDTFNFKKFKDYYDLYDINIIGTILLYIIFLSISFSVHLFFCFFGLCQLLFTNRKK